MFGGTAGVIALVIGVLVVLLIAGTALLMHARRRRPRPAPARRTSWPRTEEGRDTHAGDTHAGDTHAGDTQTGGTGRRQHRTGDGTRSARPGGRSQDADRTARIPLDRGPIAPRPIDSETAQRDPQTVVTRRDTPAPRDAPFRRVNRPR